MLKNTSPERKRSWIWSCWCESDVAASYAERGMQKYLPAELRFEYKPNQSPTIFHSLIQPKPWYSHYGNDLFSSSVFTNNLNTNNLGTNGMGINTHILGNRHYELTNHLGNVQATVIDRTSPVIDTNQNDTLLGYLADISTAQDYYPFGMLMPGRYTSDTIKHCVTINSVVLVSKPLDVKATKPQAVALAYKYGASPAPPSVGQLPKAASFADEVLHVFHYNPLNEHPNGWVVQTTAAEDHIEYDIDLSDEPGELDAYLQLHMDTNQTDQLFGFGIELHEDVIVEMRVRQYANAQQDEYYDAVDWTTISTGGAQEFLVPVNKNAINAGGNTILQFKITSVGSGTFASGLTVKATTPWTLKTQLVPENRVVTICDEKDNYRFGFTGGEKLNEIMGIGNYVDLGERGVDIRIGRLNWKPDPLAAKFPHQSPYVYAGNSPIQFIDKNGEFKYPKGKQGDEFRKTYPMITLYLANHIQKDVNKSSRLASGIVIHAKNPEFGRKELSEDVLAWSDKSRVTITYVEGDRIASANAWTRDSRNIYINKDYAQAVENVLSDKGKKYTPEEKQQAITAFYITMMDETTLVGSKYSKDPLRRSDGGSDGDVGNDLTDEIFYSKDGEKGYHRMTGDQADKDNLKGTKNVIKTIKDEGRSDVLPTTPTK